MYQALRNRCRRWLDASLANRLTAILMALTIGLTGIVGFVNFAYLYKVTHDQTRHELNEQTEDVTLAIEVGLSGIADHIGMLALNPTIVSSLLDVRDQETHLTPLLQRTQRKDHHPLNVCVVNHKGAPLACLNPAQHIDTSHATFGKAIAKGHIQAHIVRDIADLHKLVVIAPVIYEGTGLAEGAVIAEFDLAKTLRPFIKIERYVEPGHVHLSDRHGTLLTMGDEYQEIIIARTPSLPPPLDELQLAIEFGFDESQFYGPLHRLTTAYVLISILLAILIQRLVMRMTPFMTQRIERLTQQADRVASGEAFSFGDEDPSADEIGRLSRSFGMMTYLLRRTNESLEQQVADRTAALKEQQDYSEALFHSSQIPLVVMDPESSSFVDCNQAAIDIYRLGSRDDVLGKSPIDVSAPTQYDGSPSAEAALTHIRRAREHGQDTFEWRHQRPNGELWDAEVRLMRFQYSGQELLQFSLHDITEKKRSDAEIWHRANFDPLTGLANRGLCLDRLTRSLAHARRSGNRVGVLFIDLDGFKNVNDSLGHAAGDELLIEAAQRLEGCVREQDTACRMGGDEFVLVVHDLPDRSDLLRVAASALSHLGEPFTLAEGTRQISGSIGIAVFPEDGDNADTLLTHADKALYHAKRSGKNRYSFYTTTID